MVDRYGDRFKSGIVICNSCFYVDKVDKPITKCPECELQQLASWDSLERFKGFITNCNTSQLNIQHPELKKIYNEVKGVM